MQEGVCKDVEHDFGVLQVQWVMLQNLAHLWNESTMKMVWILW